MSDQSIAKPHDIAAGEINGWRGRCLNLFAKAERAVALTLEIANQQNASLTIRHLSGQRLADLAKFAEGIGQMTEKQHKALLFALESWQRVECKRVYLAHGVLTVLLDRQADWHVQLDFTRYLTKSREPQRWNCSRREAEQFEAELEKGFKDMSAQLGHLRKRLAS